MCILVVEDDLLIRMILVEELVDAGYDVKEAETGDRAVDLLEEIDQPLSMLITDIHMPGSRSGIEVAAHVRHRMPHVPVIFTTGRPDALRGAHHLQSGQYLIRKPYIPKDIIAWVERLLKEQGSAPQSLKAQA